ncbi:MAG: hypothetical protein GX684_05940 [Ruminococcaceae bacterium]|nr:hypothetical protein [Oscillospiraceae bacterium]
MKHIDVKPRALTEEEKKLRDQGVYDSFANYIVYCETCGKVESTNMYIMSAERRAKMLKDKGVLCDVCNLDTWAVGYPENSMTGFGTFEKKTGKKSIFGAKK